MMKNIQLVVIIVGSIVFAFNDANAQQLDTVYFSCSFDRLGIKVKNVEIYDINNNHITILDNYHGRNSFPVQVILNINSDTLVIRINQRFSFRKTLVFLKKQDIQKKYIHLWRNFEKKFEFSYSDYSWRKL